MVVVVVESLFYQTAHRWACLHPAYLLHWLAGWPCWALLVLPSPCLFAGTISALQGTCLWAGLDVYATCWAEVPPLAAPLGRLYCCHGSSIRPWPCTPDNQTSHDASAWTSIMHDGHFASISLYSYMYVPLCMHIPTGRAVLRASDSNATLRGTLRLSPLTCTHSSWNIHSEFSCARLACTTCNYVCVQWSYLTIIQKNTVKCICCLLPN